MSNQRFLLKDYYSQPDQRYLATFSHISTHNGVPAALLIKLFLVNKNGDIIKINRNNFYDNNEVSDHVWIDLNKNWLKLKTELFYGDQIEFDAKVEKYHIARDNILKKRNEIWNNSKIEINNIRQTWNSQKNFYHGQAKQQKYLQIQAQIKSNIVLTRQRQKQLPLVDYGLTDIKNIEIKKLVPLLPYRSFKRINYNLKSQKKYGYKYNIWIAKRTKQYIKLLKLKKKPN